MIKVLHYTPSYNYGGIETFTMETSKYLKDKCHFTYVVEVNVSEDKLKEIEKNNGDIIRIPNLTKEGFIKNFLACYRLFKDNDFDVVHVHDCNIRFFVMMFASFFKIKKRIYHIHSINFDGSFIAKKIKKFCFKLNLFFSNQILSCSNEAARIKLKNKKFTIINNGINVDKFKFNEIERKKMRSLLKINNNCKIILCVGRLSLVKNFSFMIDIMKKLTYNNADCKLIIVGDGEERENLIEKVEKNNIQKNVIFVGKQSEVEKYYSAADLFCLPSLREGLGIVLIEAQANGIPCIASVNVPKEVNITNEVVFIDTNNEEGWINQIEKKHKRYNKNKIINNKGYNIIDSSNKLYDVYVNE